MHKIIKNFDIRCPVSKVGVLLTIVCQSVPNSYLQFQHLSIQLQHRRIDIMCEHQGNAWAFMRCRKRIQNEIPSIKTGLDETIADTHLKTETILRYSETQHALTVYNSDENTKHLNEQTNRYIDFRIHKYPTKFPHLLS